MLDRETKRAVEALTREFRKVNTRLDRIEAGGRTSQLSSSSLEDAALPVYDGDGNERQRIGKQSDGTFAVTHSNGPPPPVPSAATVTPDTLGLAITYDGGFVGGAAQPSDFSHVRIHVSDTSGVIGPVAATLSQAGQVTVSPLAVEPKYVVLVAVNTSGTVSDPSAEVSATPNEVVASDVLDGIIDELALADDAVTNAKIAADAVGTAQIQGQAVTLSELADGSVDASKILFDARKIGAPTVFRQPTEPIGEFGQTWGDDFVGADGDPLDSSYIIALSGDISEPPTLTGDGGVVTQRLNQGASIAVQDVGDDDVDLTVSGLGTDLTSGFMRWILCARVQLPLTFASEPYLASGYQISLSDATVAGEPGVVLHRNGVQVATGPAFDRSIDFTMRLLVVGGDVKVRWWPTADPEPSTWQVEYTDSSPLPAGAAGFGMYKSGNRPTTTLAPFTIDTLIPPVAGDTWFDSDDDNKPYRYDGTAWQPFTLGTAALTAESVTAAIIAANTITASQIAAEAIGTDELAANSVIAGKIASDSIETRHIVARAIQAGQIAVETILAENLATDSVTTRVLKALSVTADELAANSVIADKIDAGAVTADKLSANAIDGKTITGALLRTDASGNRVLVRNATGPDGNDQGRLEYITGVSGHSPGQIVVAFDSATGEAYLFFAAPGPDGGAGPSMQLLDRGAQGLDDQLFVDADIYGALDLLIDRTARIGARFGFHLLFDNLSVTAMDDATQNTLRLNPGGDVELGSGRNIAGIDFGWESLNPNSSGQMFFSHSLGVTPSMVLVGGQASDPSTVVRWAPAGTDVNTIQVNAHDINGNPVTGTTGVIWIALV